MEGPVTQLLHAALERTDHIGPEHLASAAALVRYSIASARAVISPDDTLTKLAAWISEGGPEGRIRKEITTTIVVTPHKASRAQ